MAYLIALHLKNRPCVVVGGGHVAARKIRDLLAEGAHVTVISPELSAEISVDRVHHIAKHYDQDDLTQIKPVLVFAATDQPDVNRAVVQDAQTLGALVNSADASDDDDFDNVVQIEKTPFTIGISTGGASPALAVNLRDAINDVIGDAYPLLATWLGELRPQLKERVPSSQARHEFWERVLASDVLTLIQNGQQAEAHDLLHHQFEQFTEATRA